MSKGQRGNKEAKKPKQAHTDKPVGPLAAMPAVAPQVPDRQKKK